jgi:hypothetical protein
MGFKSKMELLYRVSDDGDQASKFWEKCLNKPNTILLAESQRGKRFGAYREFPYK